MQGAEPAALRRLAGEFPGPGLPHGDRGHPGGHAGVVLCSSRPCCRRASVALDETDALEFALVTLLTVIFSPLSFNYAYVWLLYPIALALHRVISEPAAPRHRLKVAWMAAVLLIPTLAIPMPQVAQAYGNLFVPACSWSSAWGRCSARRGELRWIRTMRAHPLASSSRITASEARPSAAAGTFELAARSGTNAGSTSATLALPFSGRWPTMPPLQARHPARERGGWTAHGWRSRVDRDPGGGGERVTKGSGANPRWPLSASGRGERCLVGVI